MTTTVRTLATLCGLAAVAIELPAQRPGAPPVAGRWDITVTGANATYPSWLEVQWSGDRVLVGRFVGRSGSSRPISRLEVTHDTLRFSIPPQWDQGDQDLHFEGVLAQDRLAGWMTEASGTRVNWTQPRASKGIRVPATTCRMATFMPIALMNSPQSSRPWSVTR